MSAEQQPQNEQSAAGSERKLFSEARHRSTAAMREDGGGTKPPPREQSAASKERRGRKRPSPEKMRNEVLRGDIDLMTHAALPDWLKDNEYLLDGHRPHLPCILTCFRSVFSIHSETVNIWTHLLGSLTIVALAIWFYFIKQVPNSEPFTWQKVVVFLAFFSSAVACMSFSWLYHTLYCHSTLMYSVFSKLDYSGIAFLIFGSFVPFLYYAFYCRPTLMILYISSMTILSSLCLVLCLWNKFAAPVYRHLRASTFVGLGLSGVVPYFHSVAINGAEFSQFPYVASVALLYIGGAVVYAMRVPERYIPGKLDIWGHSHQIFHVMVVAAAVTYYFGISRMAEERATIGAFCPSE